MRARLLARHRLGRQGARALAELPLGQALDALTASPYGEALAGTADLVEAQHRIAASVLWNLRVLAGWLPPGGAEPLRVLAAWFEIANVRARLAHFASPGTAPRLFELGTLATAARRLDAATSASELRRVLASSRWGDPGGAEPGQIVDGMRLAWYRRVHGLLPEAATWADAAVVLWAARARFGSSSRPAGALPQFAEAEAASLPELAAALPGRLRWVLDGIAEPGLLWRAEARWWQRVEADALSRLSGWSPGPANVLATVALLAADAWRMRGVLSALADRPAAEDVLDAIA